MLLENIFYLEENSDRDVGTTQTANKPDDERKETGGSKHESTNDPNLECKYKNCCIDNLYCNIYTYILFSLVLVLVTINLFSIIHPVSVI